MIRSQICLDILNAILDIISMPSNVKHVLAKREDIFMKWPENVRCQTAIKSTVYTHVPVLNHSEKVDFLLVYSQVNQSNNQTKYNHSQHLEQVQTQCVFLWAGINILKCKSHTKHSRVHNYGQIEPYKYTGSKSTLGTHFT